MPRAFAVLWLLQRACEVQLATAALGPVRRIAESVQRQCTADSLLFNPDFGAGRDVLQALTRQVDRIDPGYRA